MDLIQAVRDIGEPMIGLFDEDIRKIYEKMLIRRGLPLIAQDVPRMASTILFLVLVEPALDATSAEEILLVAREACLFVPRIMKSERWWKPENSNIFYVTRAAAGDVNNITSDCTLLHMTRLLSMHDVPDEVMYPILISYGRSRRARIFQAMSKNPTYMLRFFEGHCYGDIFLSYIVNSEHNVLNIFSLSMTSPFYGRYWDAVRQCLLAGGVPESMEFARRMGPFESTKKSKEFLSKLSHHGKEREYGFLLRLGGQKTESSREITRKIVFAPTTEQGKSVEFVKAMVDFVEVLMDMGNWRAEERYHHPLWPAFYGYET